MVTVNPNPVVTVAAGGNTVICKADPLVLTATGGGTYNWFNQATTPAITFTSNFTAVQTLTVRGTDANGCSSIGSIQVQVKTCAGISEVSKAGVSISIYPNPNSGEFFVSSTSDIDLNLINELGQHVKSVSLNKENSHKVNLTGIADGVYFIVGRREKFTNYYLAQNKDCLYLH